MSEISRKIRVGPCDPNFVQLRDSDSARNFETIQFLDKSIRQTIAKTAWHHA
jgi:hypothetical protein